ncbi:MAG: copper homeostasis protein CutC [Hespellia sp.]|nr:copper homeostasis protein CutC [Hespellia sp.]
MKKLEVCVDSAASAAAAFGGGADRIELCSNLIIGGTSPSPELFRQIRKKCGIPIRVLIRPRFGDFCYDDDEFEIMLREVKMFCQLGADAVVVGVLTPEGDLDIRRMKTLKEAAGETKLTLHRAFDVCRDPFQTLEEAITLGLSTILTSGQANSAIAGKTLLKELTELAGDRIEILVGAGVSPENVKDLIEATHAPAYHMSGKVIQSSHMIYRKEGINMGLPGFSEYEIWQTEEEKIRAARKILDRE